MLGFFSLRCGCCLYFSQHQAPGLQSLCPIHYRGMSEEAGNKAADQCPAEPGVEGLSQQGGLHPDCSICHMLMVPKVRLLYSLAFNARFLWHLWVLISSMTTRMITGSIVPLLQVISRGSPMSLEDSGRIISLFYLFSSLFIYSLISIHDKEFF
ncbi:hypothetical protein H1C71_025525 [Ictidomys tridecemlineatus]|nr:hypothetical protein H1C71_025525 [Ictidomys tridecemlineatus]KAG3289178.1 hypothetical protein H1C71_025525 [Ictidomys tridecemlineatus]